MTESAIAGDGEIQTPDNPEEVGKVNEFFNQSKIKNDLHWFTYRDTLDRAYNRDDRRLFYTTNDPQITGGLMVWCESRVLAADEAQIRLVAVDPDNRGRGIGRRLCEQAEAFASEHGPSRMIADVASGSPAVEFWTACGYEIVDEWQTSGGREMYQVGKPL